MRFPLTSALKQSQDPHLLEVTQPGQRIRRHRVGQPGGWLDIHHLHRPVRADQQEVRHVTPDPAADRCTQQERLRRDRYDIGVKVG